MADWKKKNKNCAAKDRIIAHYIKKCKRGQITHDEYYDEAVKIVSNYDLPLCVRTYNARRARGE